MWSLYFLHGMSNIFLDLDKEITGIYNIWQNRMRRVYDFWIILGGVSVDRTFYRTKRKEINKHLKSDFEKCVLWMLLYLKPTKLMMFFYRGYLKTHKLIKHL
jgi:hypothetical protein